VALGAHERLVDDLHDEVVVAPAEGAPHPGEAGIARKVGAGIHFEHVDLTLVVDPEVHPAIALAGWICWGPTPCTLGTYDLYWMAVDPALHGGGVGSALLHAMEGRLAGLARLIVVETAGRADYAPTRGFYEARGYRAVSRIPDFYAPGDDQVVYTKSLAGSPSR
jgi:ribosomal protein S18 acetylase RimI-like enzyme